MSPEKYQETGSPEGRQGKTRPTRNSSKVVASVTCVGRRFPFRKVLGKKRTWGSGLVESMLTSDASGRTTSVSTSTNQCCILNNVVNLSTLLFCCSDSHRISKVGDHLGDATWRSVIIAIVSKTSGLSLDPPNLTMSSFDNGSQTGQAYQGVGLTCLLHISSALVQVIL